MTAVLIALENAGARGSSSGKAGAEGPLSSSLSSGEAGQWGSPDTEASGARYPVSSNLGSAGTMTTYSNTPLA